MKAKKIEKPKKKGRSRRSTKKEILKLNIEAIMFNAGIVPVWIRKEKDFTDKLL